MVIKQVLLAVYVAASSLWAKSARKISMEEVAIHSRSDDCWMEIEGKIYDVSEYSREHKSQHEYDYAKWCGKAASQGWLEKDGIHKPHKRKAQRLLESYQIGIKSSQAK